MPPLSRLATALTLLLSLTGCGALSSDDDRIGVARQAEGDAPIVGSPFNAAPAGTEPVSIDDPILASRGHDFLIAWADRAPGSSGVLAARRFAADGAPTDDMPTQLLAPTIKETLPGVLSAACAPDGDCVVISTEGPEQQFSVSTLRPDGTHENVFVPVPPPASPIAQVAYDSDLDSFLVVWNGPAPSGLHFANGVAVEQTPLTIVGDGLLATGVACAPSAGCLVTSVSSDLSETAVTQVTSEVGEAIVIPGLAIGALCFGGGVYFGQIFQSSGSLVRLGLDGALLDATPISISIAGRSPALGRVVGSGFDGDAFTVVLAFENNVFVAGRIAPDGTPATPASVDLSLLGPFVGQPGVNAFACGDDTCELLRASNTDGAAPVSAVALRHGVPTASKHDLLVGTASQDFGTALAIDGRVLAFWNEGPTLRRRWFTGDGEPDGPTLDLAEPRSVVHATSSDDLGLLVLEALDGTLETRIVAADGSISAGRPLASPKQTKHEPARFALLDESESSGPLYMHRFDAEGRALDPDSGLLIVRTQAPLSNAVMAHAGDSFFVVTEVEDEPPSIVRISDSGHVQKPQYFGVDAMLSAESIACTKTECGVLWVDPKSHQWFGSFRSTDKFVLMTPKRFDTGKNGRLVHDGVHFLALYQKQHLFHAARFDGAGTKRSFGSLNEVENIAVAPGDGNVVVFGTTVVEVGTPPRTVNELVVRTVIGEPMNGGAGGGGSNETSTSPPVASGGCACAFDASADSSGASLAALALALASIRRRRRFE